MARFMVKMMAEDLVLFSFRYWRLYGEFLCWFRILGGLATSSHGRPT
jgi:hypothetical protein